jgi:hypothetical protein
LQHNNIKCTLHFSYMVEWLNVEFLFATTQFFYFSQSTIYDSFKRTILCIICRATSNAISVLQQKDYELYQLVGY